METRSRRIRELEVTLEAKDIELKESASLVDRVKALHSEQCHELQRQIEEVGNWHYQTWDQLRILGNCSPTSRLS